MRIEEAKHIKCILEKYTGNSSTSEVLLNLGSSTEDFRKIQQPHIDRYVFQPLDKLKYNTIHFDLKSDKGVDISGNIFDSEVQNKLKETRPTIVMCCNLLEHLEENSRDEMQNIFNKLLEKNGILLITVPYSYPMHLDPIDTYFRPSPQDLRELFPDYKILDVSIVVSTTFMDEYLAYSLYTKIRILIRIFTPIYKYKVWKSLMHRMLWLSRNYKISCIMLKKT